MCANKKYVYILCVHNLDVRMKLINMWIRTTYVSSQTLLISLFWSNGIYSQETLEIQNVFIGQTSLLLNANECKSTHVKSVSIANLLQRQLTTIFVNCVIFFNFNRHIKFKITNLHAKVPFLEQLFNISLNSLKITSAVCLTLCPL